MTELEKKIQRLRVRAPKWRPEYAKKADETSVSGGWVKTQTDHAPLLDEPISNILAKALELSGRSDDSLTEHDPFAGLSAEAAERAIAALREAADRDVYPEWAWRKFLSPQARNNDSPEFATTVAEQVVEMPQKALNTLLYEVSIWLHGCRKTLAGLSLELWDGLLRNLIGTLKKYPTKHSSTIVRSNQEKDWSSEAINSPAGNITLALMEDPRIVNLKPDKGLPPEWVYYLDQLLRLVGDSSRYALVFLVRNLAWFYAHNEAWTEKALLSFEDGERTDNSDAFWDGFLRQPRVPTPKLYARIKPALLRVAKDREFSRRGHAQVLAGIILAGWGMKNKETGNRLVSNEEMRDFLVYSAEEYRTSLIWTLKRWMASPAPEDSEGHSENDEDGRTDWRDLASELLRDVWPRQISVKTPKTSSQLFDLAFSDSENFVELADSVLPLLSPVDEGHLIMFHLRKSEGGNSEMLEAHPEKTLALVYAVLSDKVARWPHGIGEIIQKIEEADPTLQSDARLLELKRKWDAR